MPYKHDYHTKKQHDFCLLNTKLESMNVMTFSFCCKNQKLIHTDTDVVCAVCGTVSDEQIHTAPTACKSKVIACDESRTGTAQISPSSILHSRTHRNILESRTNPYDKKLYDACSILKIGQTHCRRALYIFHAVQEVKKMQYGVVAFFSIYQTCKENGIHTASKEIADAVTNAFDLKREMRSMKAIFAVKMAMIDSDKKIHFEKVAFTEEQKHLRAIDSDKMRMATIHLAENFGSMDKALAIMKHFKMDGA